MPSIYSLVLKKTSTHKVVLMTLMTIGQLAKQVGVRTSTLRYYEEQGLLTPTKRSEAGYRLYVPEAEQTLRFIQRAQRIGFSLTDIRTLLQEHPPGNETVAAIAESRFAELERQLTEIRVMRHELELFLLDLQHRIAGNMPPELLFERLVNQICMVPLDQPPADSRLNWLMERTDCALANMEKHELLDALRGRHVHIWQEEDSYHILVVGHDPAVKTALEELAQLEAHCHAHPSPDLSEDQEGYHFVARGQNAFIFAQLFLALEQESG
jgi:DNA-binding transcriptional MerR regulator